MFKVNLDCITNMTKSVFKKKKKKNPNKHRIPLLLTVWKGGIPGAL